MKRIETYEEYSALCTARLCRGVCMNEIPDTQKCRAEIGGGSLYAEESEGALLLFRDRGTHLRMNFYLQHEADAELPGGKPIVTEIAFRERDKALAQTVEFWITQGFEPCFERTRLSLKTDPVNYHNDDTVRFAELSDADQAYSLLMRNFDPLTGCLPAENELRDMIANGQILLTEGGLLHFSLRQSSAELRHLAVDEEFRRLGKGGALISRFLLETRGMKRLVWVRRGNESAESLYQKFGFAADGWRSAVLIRK